MPCVCCGGGSTFCDCPGDFTPEPTASLQLTPGVPAGGAGAVDTAIKLMLQLNVTGLTLGASVVPLEYGKTFTPTGATGTLFARIVVYCTGTEPILTLASSAGFSWPVTGHAGYTITGVGFEGVADSSVGRPPSGATNQLTVNNVCRTGTNWAYSAAQFEGSPQVTYTTPGGGVVPLFFDAPECELKATL